MQPHLSGRSNKEHKIQLGCKLAAALKGADKCSRICRVGAIRSIKSNSAAKWRLPVGCRHMLPHLSGNEQNRVKNRWFQVANFWIPRFSCKLLIIWLLIVLAVEIPQRYYCTAFATSVCASLL